MLSLSIPNLIKTLSRLEVKKKMIEEMASKGVMNAALLLEGEVKESISGRKPEPRSVDTGRFMQSVKSIRTSKLTSKVESDVPYATHLEYGTTKMKERKHFRNSLARNKEKMSGMVRASVKKII